MILLHKKNRYGKRMGKVISPDLDSDTCETTALGRAIQIDELSLLATAVFLTSSARHIALCWPLTLPQLLLILTLVFALALTSLVFRRFRRDGPFRSACRSPVPLILFERFFSDPQVTPSFFTSKNTLIVKQPDVRRRDI